MSQQFPAAESSKLLPLAGGYCFIRSPVRNQLGRTSLRRHFFSLLALQHRQFQRLQASFGAVGRSGCQRCERDHPWPPFFLLGEQVSLVAANCNTNLGSYSQPKRGTWRGASVKASLARQKNRIPSRLRSSSEPASDRQKTGNLAPLPLRITPLPQQTHVAAVPSHRAGILHPSRQPLIIGISDFDAFSFANSSSRHVAHALRHTRIHALTQTHSHTTHIL